MEIVVSTIVISKGVVRGAFVEIDSIVVGVSNVVGEVVVGAWGQGDSFSGVGGDSVICEVTVETGDNVDPILVEVGSIIDEVVVRAGAEEDSITVRVGSIVLDCSIICIVMEVNSTWKVLNYTILNSYIVKAIVVNTIGSIITSKCIACAI